MSQTAVADRPRAAPSGVEPRRGNPVSRWWRDPWRKPHILGALTWLYLAWSIIPVAIAIALSFNSGRSNSVWQGFSFHGGSGTRRSSRMDRCS